MSRLILIRGLPGSGKSTFAKTFGCFHVEADMFHVRDGEYKWEGKKVKQAHEWCKDITRRSLLIGLDVVVSNTFTTLKEMAPYVSLVKLDNYPPATLTVYKMTSQYQNIHNVPEETLKKMRDRWEDFEGEIILV